MRGTHDPRANNDPRSAFERRFVLDVIVRNGVWLFIGWPFYLIFAWHQPIMYWLIPAAITSLFSLLFAFLECRSVGVRPTFDPGQDDRLRLGIAHGCLYMLLPMLVLLALFWTHPYPQDIHDIRIRENPLRPIGRVFLVLVPMLVILASNGFGNVVAKLLILGTPGAGDPPATD